jgi:predicted Zn-dependent protease
MSVQSDVETLKNIQARIKILSVEMKKLRQEEKNSMERIQEFLKHKDLPGVKHQGVAIKIEEKEARERKKPKEQVMDAIAVLKKYNIDNPEKVLEELTEAKKGEPIIKEKLKLQKIKQ